ncbi:MAG TPA: carboxypeptidase-like regulatory domain-containing protein [Vicinamibacterales bacterium]
MVRKAMLSLLLAVSWAAPAWSQVQTGRIVGRVRDPQQAAIHRAAVTVTSAATGESQTVATNEHGDYVVTPVDPGRYQVSVVSQGFQTAVVTAVEVPVGQSLRVDVELKVGALSETTEVTASAPLLDTESGTLGHNVTNTQITNLPLNGRSFYELARLTPGAAGLPGGGNLVRIRANFISGTAISGVRGSQLTFQIDGVDVTDHHQGGSYIQTSVDALQEFRVQQSAYSAEFSQAGGMLNAATKSGTSQFHGGLFEFLRNDRFDATDFFVKPKQKLDRHQFGGTLGGPLVKGKTFFFLSYEGIRENQGLPVNLTVGSAAMKRGDFSAVRNRIYDPLTGQPFPNNVIPASRLSPQALYFARFIPDPNVGANNFTWSPERTLDADQVTLRIDQSLSEKHKVFMRYSFHDNRMDDPSSTLGAPYLAYPELGSAHIHTRGQNFVAALTSTLSPTLLNEFRFSYLPQVVDLEPFGLGTNFYQEAGIRGFEETGRPGVVGSFPDFSWSGYSNMQGSAFDQRPKTQDLKVFEWTDNVTLIRDRDILKAGTKIRRWLPHFTDSKQYQGIWTYNGFATQNPASPAGTGDAFADFMLGYPRQVQRAFPADTFGGQATYAHFYLQDDVRVSSRLSLNLGLRYEYSPWAGGYRGQLGTFDPLSPRPIIVASETDQIDLDSQFSGPSAYALFRSFIQTSSQAGLPIQITSTDKTQFGPRFGFAWRPFGEKTVLRGGYGIFFEQENTDGRVNNNMVPFRLDEIGINDLTQRRTMADFFLGRALTTSAAPSLGPTATELKMGRNHHFNVGVQQEISPSTVLEVNYVGNVGRHLNGTTNINIPSPAAGGVQARRPYPLFGGIAYFDTNMNNTYHSLQATLVRRASKGLWYLVSYTFSKSITTQNNPSVGGNTGREKAISPFDVPHNLALSVGWELPFGRGKRHLGDASGATQALLGGWQVQAIYIWRSGRPFTPTIGADRANTGVGNQRPNRVASGELDNPTVDRWFDPTAFVLPAQFTYGDSGANILREDSYKNLDFSVFKRFGNKLELRVEVFNLTNTPSFSAPLTAIDTATAGRVTSTFSTPRQMQLGLKFMF